MSCHRKLYCESHAVDCLNICWLDLGLAVKYGRTLLSELPDDTTQLLDVYSGVGNLSSGALSSTAAASANESVGGQLDTAEAPTASAATSNIHRQGEPVTLRS